MYMFRTTISSITPTLRSSQERSALERLADHSMGNYTSLIDMYSDLALMSHEQQQKVQKAWVGFLNR